MNDTNNEQRVTDTKVLVARRPAAIDDVNPTSEMPASLGRVVVFDSADTDIDQGFFDCRPTFENIERWKAEGEHVSNGASWSIIALGYSAPASDSAPASRDVVYGGEAQQLVATVGDQTIVTYVLKQNESDHVALAIAIGSFDDPVYVFGVDHRDNWRAMPIPDGLREEIARILPYTVSLAAKCGATVKLVDKVPATAIDQLNDAERWEQDEKCF